jgi:hypothetical protein
VKGNVMIQNGIYKAQPVNNKDHFTDLKKQKKMIRVLLLTTASWPHTFREEETESFHKRMLRRISVSKKG